MNTNEERLKEIIKEVAKKFNLKSWKYKSNETMKTIENYFGVLIPVTVSGTMEHTNNSEGTVTLHLLIKTVPNTIDERIESVLKILYNADAFFYTSLVPIYSRLTEITINELVPICYYADLQPGKQALVLQDMTHEGYIRCKKNQRFLDYDHIDIALKALAKFHALSVITIEKGMDPANTDILTPYTDIYPIELNITIKLAFDNHIKLFDGTKYENYLKKLRSESRYKSIRLDSYQKVRRLVHGHGDYWKENILFQYKDDIPIKACIVDFQTMRSMCPAQDFLCFILVSIDAETRAKYYEVFLQTYLHSIKAFLLKCNETLPTSYEEDFMHDLKIVAENCILTSFMGFALWYGLENDTLIKSKFTADTNAVMQFVDTISNIVNDLERFGYISL